MVDKLEDMNGLRSMAAAFYFESMDGHAAPLAPDGRVDIYTMLKGLDDTTRDELVRFCFSARAGKGPSTAEFEAGDYTNFPYQRRRGALAGFAPVAWEREPRGGERLVAVSDGSFRVWDEARMQQFFRDNPGQE